MDQRIFELIHGDVDGELTPSEQEELQHWLATSEAARQEHARARSLTEMLAAMRPQEPPVGMRATILDALPPRTAPAGASATARRRSGLGLVAALAATAAGVVFLLQRDPDVPQLDPASLAGTIARPAAGPDAPMWRLEDTAVSGTFRLRQAEQGLYMEVDVEAIGQITLVARIGGRPLEVEGLVPIDGPPASPKLADGGIQMLHSGEHRYAILLRRPAGADEPVELAVYAGDRLVGEARLGVGRAGAAPQD